MADLEVNEFYKPTTDDFYRRVASIERQHARGYGMEAPGTLGRSFYARKPTGRRSYIAPVLLVLMCLTGLKAVLHTRIGADVYAERVQALMEGQDFERLGGYVMQAGPVTLALSHELQVWGF